MPARDAHRTQYLMLCAGPDQCCAQRRQVDIRSYLVGGQHQQSRISGKDLFMNPEILLGWGERSGRCGGGQPGAVTGRDADRDLRQPCGGPFPVNLAHGQNEALLATQARHQAHGEQRVPAQVEKVVSLVGVGREQGRSDPDDVLCGRAIRWSGSTGPG